MKNSLFIIAIIGLLGMVAGLIGTFFDESIMSSLITFNVSAVVAVTALFIDKKQRG
jgi:hypothetical protein